MFDQIENKSKRYFGIWELTLYYENSAHKNEISLQVANEIDSFDYLVIAPTRKITISVFAYLMM